MSIQSRHPLAQLYGILRELHSARVIDKTILLSTRGPWKIELTYNRMRMQSMIQSMDTIVCISAMQRYYMLADRAKLLQSAGKS
jgi:hypothetical protein